ncbi:iron ABC transporter permease [Eubacterium maltosivorans]|uniref:Iron ABC transporter permease n=1 Tax=Eubacterium maltosivorans TaxID=2041044 RepID=A0A4V1GMK4_EUBML|nr:iron ABC transporter permease [Eubacterium maltosivorans]
MELKVVFWIIIAIFAVFLAAPLALLLIKSFNVDGSFSLASYAAVLSSAGFLNALLNSFIIAGTSALVTTVIAFMLAYTVNSTNVPGWYKSAVSSVAVLPMLLPTITYGFAIIYSFGRQGLITRLLGFQPFEIYGFNGLLLGYVIYTVPIAFMLINNTFKYIDKKFSVVSRVLGDNSFKTFLTTTFKPLIATLGASFIQAFFLSFTDFGIPASVGGEYKVVATTLYNQMLGSIPNFSKGAVVAMMMLIPSVFSILILRYLEKYNFHYNKISQIELTKNKGRDGLFTVLSALVMIGILSIFAVIFIVPFVQSWPYELGFSLDNIKETLFGGQLTSVYLNSILVAALTAVLGTAIAYLSALVTARSKMGKPSKAAIDGLVQTTNTVPGMVLGIAFLLAFSGTSLQCTFIILIICNIIHYFSTPYLMIKNSLSKMNASWETTGMLMGDSWTKTIFRVVIPNSWSTVFEMFSYYFINAMVTISAVIFIVGARTMVVTTKIKQLQHFGDFEQIFVLSLLILATNLAVKLILKALSKKTERKAA